MARAVYRRIRAPEENGAALVEPSVERALHLVQTNRQLLADQERAWPGGGLTAAAKTARREVLEIALSYTRQYRDTALSRIVTEESPFILAGHQPELFHPGVWFKNYLLSSLAEKACAVALNLIIDTDAVHGTGIRVPTMAADQVHAELVPFDAPGAACAWEERQVIDHELLLTFPGRVRDALRSVGCPSPDGALVNPLWNYVPAGKQLPLLGTVLARARHRLEADIGLKTLEVPMSGVCQTASFRRFAVHLLQELHSLRQVYNAALAEYRHANRIRSHTHPAPALAEQDGWLEAPFFLWTNDDPGRRALYVRRKGRSLELTDRQRVTIGIELPIENAIEQLAASEAQGIKLRPRALMTTMYARLLLSDLFIHGIGGAKYDELTDLIIRRFFAIEPPAYLTATATFRLSLDETDVSQQDVRASADWLRAFRYRPETLGAHPIVAQDSNLASKLSALASQKRDFLARHNLRRCAPAVYQRLDGLNAAMRDVLRPLEAQFAVEHEALLRRLGRSRVLRSREFSTLR